MARSTQTPIEIVPASGPNRFLEKLRSAQPRLIYCEAKSSESAAAPSAPRHPINQNIPRLRAFAGADNAAVFQFIHDPRRAGVPQPEPALQEGHTRALFAANDFDALLDEVFILIDAPLFVAADGGPGKLLMDFHLVARWPAGMNPRSPGSRIVSTPLAGSIAPSRGGI